NSGCWRTIEIRAPSGSVVNAEFPAPVVYANHEMSHRVADMIMGALVNFLPEQVMACSQGTSAILTLGGVDLRNGRQYVSYETIKGGFGTRPNKDGINCIASGISNGPVLQATLGQLREHPIVGDVRGTGLILGMELMQDGEKRIPFNSTL